MRTNSFCQFSLFEAAGFITKPFRNAELMQVIESILEFNEPNKTAQVGAKLEFCKVSIEEFVARARIDFDVYIKLSETKTIKLANKGEIIPKDRVKQYKDKGIRHLHILKEDFSKLVDFNINVTKIIKDR